MSLRFRTKVFGASLGVAAAALLLATLIIAWELRDDERASIEQQLHGQALLIAELLARNPEMTGPGIDAEADRLATGIGVRVTLIQRDGSVVGDSSVDGQTLAALDNHLNRPEVQLARDGQVAIVERYSTTVQADMVYAAVAASHPQIAYVRVALPLTAVAQQVRRVGADALIAFALAAPVAIVLAWLSSALLARRVQSIAALARRYGEGDMTRSSHDYGNDELGDVARVLDTWAQDVQHRVDELARDRAHMAAILSGMIEGVLVLDRQGRVQLANRAAQQMLNVDDSALGRHYLEAIRHPDITAQLTAALNGNDVTPQELSLGRDASRLFMTRAAPVIGAADGGAVLVLHDVTDLRRMDQIRRDFVANVSHELRTPLTAIRGYVEVLLDDQSDPAQTRHSLEVIARHSNRMERLVADLLRLARLDARQELLDVAPCDIEEIFAAVVTDCASTIERKSQHVHTLVSAEASTVNADPAKLHDIVRNLVENAVHYAPENADVRLETLARDGGVDIIVSNSGPEIPVEDLGRVFERFYRVDKARSHPGGVGLGLAIVRHLTELHGGRASVQNLPEGGVQFTISLPA
ncbi:MAG: ATP-binding protein [Acidobacteria bacterium]|nr:ATP-binding protein [Acidobacteriota bacterium]